MEQSIEKSKAWLSDQKDAKPKSDDADVMDSILQVRVRWL